MDFPSSCREVEEHSSSNQDLTMQSSFPQAVGQRKSPCLICGKGIDLIVGHSSGKVFPPRAARCREDGEDLVGHRKSDLLAQARLGVVDKGSLPPQRSPYHESHRERISSLRLERLWMGIKPQQMRGGQRFLGKCLIWTSTSPSRN